MKQIKDCYFEESLSRGIDPILVSGLWNEVFVHYSAPERRYHTLDHLVFMHELLSPLKNECENWPSVFYAIIYHDLIYDVRQTNNEELSSERAMVCMKKLNLPESLIMLTSDLILATKLHESPHSNDFKLFLDADLAILAAPSDSYIHYYQQIRQEYLIYPDDVYEKGRVNALMHFLKMERIYQSDYFFERFEQNARMNIKNEIEMLKPRF